MHPKVRAILDRIDAKSERDFRDYAFGAKASAMMHRRSGAYQMAEALESCITALEYYADPQSWDHRVSGHGQTSQDRIINDGGYSSPAGERARKALLEE